MTSSRATTPHFIRQPWQRAAVWLGIVLMIAGLMFTYQHLAILASGGSRPALKSAINELTAAFGVGFLYFGLAALVWRAPLDTRHWERAWMYVLAWLAFGAVHTSFMWGSRHLLYPALGEGAFDYGKMPLRYAMELPMQTIAFLAIVGTLHAVRRAQLSHEDKVRAERLEKGLTQARLRNLQLQLQPHFLFNALNAISATMYRDVAEADGMLERLGDLLRIALRAPTTGQVPLELELEALQCYLDVMRSRFGERLQVSLEVPDALLAAEVPVTLLQPLVENAIRHGGVETDGEGSVTVRATEDDGFLCLQVSDVGPGAPATVDVMSRGVGLSGTAERLRLLYPGEHTFAAGNRASGGFCVEIRLPLSVGVRA